MGGLRAALSSIGKMPRSVQGAFLSAPARPAIWGSLTIARMDAPFRCPECEKSRTHILTICPRCGARVFTDENGFTRHWLMVLFILALALGTALSVVQTQGG